MPIKEGDLLDRLKIIKSKVSDKRLFIDLKTRQLRITEFANTPYTSVKISHKIKARTPITAYFDNGNITGKIVEIDGNKLILEDYVGRMLGPGESVNIIDESLEYLDGNFFTERDMEYIETSKKAGIDGFMLSYVQKKEDIDALKKLYSGSVVMSKIEDKKGLKNLKEITANSDYILAGRGDLFTELDYPHEIVNALKYIYHTAEEKAVVGSRMFQSLIKFSSPSCSDIMDIAFLKDIGYRGFLIGDDICFKKEPLIRALNIFKAIFR
jgi:pyruvate kinase